MDTKTKPKYELVISEWSDLPALTKMIKDRYDALPKTKSDTNTVFEGKSCIVELKKI